MPEIIDVFRRDLICIRKVRMDKYHTLFLSDNGSVYSSGFGVGGRLGHENEESVLVGDANRNQMCELTSFCF